LVAHITNALERRETQKRIQVCVRGKKERTKSRILGTGLTEE
jgi:hypothetical protein